MHDGAEDVVIQLSNLGGGQDMVKKNIMEVKVLFFGILSEVTGTAIKHYQEVKSINGLMQRIQDDFPEIVHYNFRISHNNIITDNDQDLVSGDEVALMPPFAGG